MQQDERRLKRDKGTIAILLLEDNETDAMIVKARIEQAFTSDYQFVHVRSLEAARNALERQPFDFIITDLMLPDSNGLDTVTQLTDIAPDVPLLVHSSTEDEALARKVVELGAQDYLLKGVGNADTLKRIIEYSLLRKGFVRGYQENTRLFFTFMKHTPAAVAILDADMRFVMVSNKWLQDYELVGQDVVGKYYKQVFPQTPDYWHAIYRHCLTGNRVFGEEDVYTRSDGSQEYVETDIRPWFDFGDTVGGLIIFTKFVTERVRRQRLLDEQNERLEHMVEERTRDLEIAKHEAEQANEAKSRFFTNMTHELRTPLHAIINFARFGVNKQETAEREKLGGYFRNILRGAHRLMWLVNDMLDISKVQSGGMTLDCGSHSIEVVVGNTLEELQSVILQLEEAGERAREDDPPRVEVTNHASVERAWFDPLRLQQILVNLISNAIKFSGENSSIIVTIEDAELSDNDQRQAVKISVMDQGIGIPEDEIDMVFDEFKQSSNVKSGTFSKGTGLGLAICKELVQAHGGYIKAENNSGRGVTIAFTLPVEPLE